MGTFAEFVKNFVELSEKPVMDFGSLPVRSGGAADYPPVLSIVIPVYGVELWLDDCLRSIQAQSFTAWECWLIDDGSRDLSGIICDHFARKDSRFHVIHQTNQGVSAARNAGIKRATGRYISFIDPDDFISENYFEAQISMLELHEADFSVSALYLVDKNGAQEKHTMRNFTNQKAEKQYSRTMKNNDEVQDALCRNLFSCVAWKKVFRRDFWGNTLFPLGIDLGEDMMTVPPLMVSANKAVFVPEAMYFWRQRKGSLLNGTVSKERLEKDLCASEEMYRRLVEYNPERKAEFKELKILYDIGCYNAYVKSGGKKDNLIKMKIYLGEDSEEYRQYKRDQELIEMFREIHRGNRRGK